MEEDILDRIVGHKPENAKQHRQVQKYVVKWEGHADDFDQDPKLLFADLPDVVKAYWKVVETEIGTNKSRRKIVVTARAKEAMECIEQTNLNKNLNWNRGKHPILTLILEIILTRRKRSRMRMRRKLSFRTRMGVGMKRVKVYCC